MARLRKVLLASPPLFLRSIPRLPLLSPCFLIFLFGVFDVRASLSVECLLRVLVKFETITTGFLRVRFFSLLPGEFRGGAGLVFFFFFFGLWGKGRSCVLFIPRVFFPGFLRRRGSV